MVLVSVPIYSLLIHQRILRDARTEDPFADLHEQQVSYRDVLNQSRNGL